MAADLSGLVYFGPILAFLAVFGVMVAILHKTKLISENAAMNIFLSFVIASIFITAGSLRQLVLDVIPWFVVLIIALFLMMLLVGNIKDSDKMFSKGFGWVFIVLLIIVFLVSGVKVFSHSLAPYWPTATYEDVSKGDPALVSFFSWLYSPAVKGFLLLVAVAALVTWLLVRNGALGGKKGK